MVTALGSVGAARVLRAACRRGCGGRSWVDERGELVLRCIYKPWLGRVTWDVPKGWSRTDIDRDTARLLLRGLLAPQVVAELEARLAEAEATIEGLSSDVTKALDGKWSVMP